MLLSKSALEECTKGPGTEDEKLGLIPGDPPSLEPAHDAVVVGLAPPLLDYAHLNTAFRILVGENRPRDVPGSQPDPHPDSTSGSSSGIQAQPQGRPRPPLIALHKARYLEASDHALSLGPGPFVHALESAAHTSAIVVGKPTRAFFDAVLSDLDRDFGAVRRPESDGGHSRRGEGIAVIGDDVAADLGEGAVELGLWRVLGASNSLFLRADVALRRVFAWR